jgi:dihydroflavonol-4-reductase
MRVAPKGGINVVPLATVIDGVLAAARAGRRGRRYVLGGENLEIAALFARIAAAAGFALRPRVAPAWIGPPLSVVMNLADPFVPLGAWFTPDLCGSFGRWMWFDTSRMRDELGVVAGDLDACLAATVAQLRRDGRV